MKYIDLTHLLHAQLPTYPGDPQPIFLKNNDVSKDGFTSHTLTLGTHIGTHMDAPSHMIANGKTIADYPVDYFIGHGIVLDARDRKTIDVDLLQHIHMQPKDVVLIYTGRDKLINTSEYFTDYPQITPAFAQKLVTAKIRILGMDQASPDYAPYETHKLLLKNDILIIENLTHLEELVNQPFTISALPMSYATDAAPVRVIAKIGE